MSDPCSSGLCAIGERTIWFGCAKLSECPSWGLEGPRTDRSKGDESDSVWVTLTQSQYRWMYRRGDRRSIVSHVWSCGGGGEALFTERNFYQQERQNLFSQSDALVAAGVDDAAIAVCTFSRLVLSPSDQLF